MSFIPASGGAPRWPDVPACYGWLSLDRRGNWALRGERVEHAGLIRFLNQHYRRDEAGNWLVDNGPQKVYVALEYTPWVLRLDTDGSPSTHTGSPAGEVRAALLDDEGNALLDTRAGIGLVDDRDLAVFLSDCRTSSGETAEEDALMAVMAGAGDVWWNGLPLRYVARAEMPSRFGYVPAPAA
ncbi:MAG: DUF2946 family protein [Thauera phenolivorans]|uniref:DUF2946 family protein n=1 Tax=Thauera phenolivorans TaxID=1792543 RepID=A0A7X7R7A4_9RHOO|nr:DUF2946 family protein [Thauera phenolivorans]NLF53562.1 DUF2946 family protein [Thauera phenolivorans]